MLAPGSRVGDYRLEELIREAPRAAVYRAEQSALGRKVALHVAAGTAGSPDAERFLDDARRLARIEHPNVLPVYQAGTSEGLAFAAAAAVGRPLEELLESGPLPAERAVAVASQVAAALEALGGPASVADPAAILVADEDGAARAYLSPLDAPPPAGADSASTSVARLLETMVGGLDRVPEELADVIRRGMTGAYATAGEVAVAADGAVAPPAGARRRRLAIIAVAAVLIAAVGVALVLSGDREDAPPASTAAARVVATIPVGGVPGALDFSAGSVWVATYDRRLVRVDSSTNKVVGAPIEFSPHRGESTMIVRASAGAVFAIDSRPGTIARIDSRSGRVTRRAELGPTILTAALDGNVLWVSRASPRGGELLRVSARTLRPLGEAIPAGPSPTDIEVGETALYVTDSSLARVTRFEKQTGAVRTVAVPSGAVDAVLHEGVVWVPSTEAGALTPLTDDLRRPPDSVLRPGFPLSAAVLGDDLWVLAGEDADLGGEIRLHRVDLESRRLLGRAVRLPPSQLGGRPVAGDGAIWAAPGDQRSLLRVAPSDPAPAAQVRSSDGDARVARPGSLAAGRWQTEIPGARFSFELRDDGWVAATASKEAGFLELRRFERPEVILDVVAPRQAYTKAGGVVPVRSPEQLISTLRQNPRLEVTSLPSVSLGGVPARSVELAVRPHRRYPAFCTRPCVALFASQGYPFLLEVPSVMRLSVLRVGGQTVAVTEEPRSGFRLTGQVVRSLRFR